MYLVGLSRTLLAAANKSRQGRRLAAAAAGAVTGLRAGSVTYNKLTNDRRLDRARTCIGDLSIKR